MDIAQLGFAIDSSPAIQAAENLDKLDAASRRVETGTQRMQREVQQAAAQIMESTDRIKDMVKASIAAREASGGIELSQRAIGERASASAKQVAELNAALEARANTQEAMRARLKAFEDAEARVNRAAAATTSEVKKQADSISDLLGRIDPAVRKLGELDTMERQLRDARKAGTLGQDDYVVYAQKIGKMRDAVSAAGDSMHGFSLASAGTRRELASLFGEIARGDFTALQGTLVNLVGRAGVLTGSIGGLVVGIGGLVGVLGGLAAAYFAGSREQQNFERITISTGGALGVTGGQIYDTAIKIGDATGRYGDAASALTKLGSSGKLTGEQLELAGRGAVALATMTGESVDKAVSEYLKLADKPSEAVVKLTEQYHFLTAEAYEHIQALERQGQTQDATTAALRAFADESERRAAAVVDNAGGIERAWKGVRDAVGGAWEAMKSIGRTDLQAQLSAAFATQFDLEEWKRKTQIEGIGGAVARFDAAFRPQGYIDEQIAANKKLIASLQERVEINDAVAMGERNMRTLEDEGVKALNEQSKALDSHADKQTKLAKALEETRRAYDAIRASGVTQINGMSVDQAEVERIRQLNKEYADTEGINERNQALKGLEAAERGQASAMASIASILERVRGEMSPLEKENQEFTKTLRLLGEAGGKAITEYREAVERAAKALTALPPALLTEKQIQEQLAIAINATKDAHQKATIAIGQRVTATDGLIQKLRDEYAEIEKSATQRERSNRGREIENALVKDGIEKTSELADARRKEVEDLAELIAIRREALEEQKEAARGWVNIWESAGSNISQTFADILVNGGSLMKGLADVAKNVVGQIVSYFSQLAVINPLLNQIFGRSMAVGGMSLLPTMANAGGLFGGLGGLGGTAASGGGTFDIMSPSSWLGAGKSLWSGFSTGFAKFWAGTNTGFTSSIFGSTTNLGSWGGNVFQPSGLTSGLGIAGGLYAGYNRFQDRYNLASGLAGGAAYGLGTYSLAMGLGSAATGGGFALGAGALGPIGWAAMAAMLIDKLSGGSLFGTSANKFRRGESDLNVGPGGASVGVGADFTGRKPLFGGSYHEWKVLTPSQEQIDAANGFFKALQDQSTIFAKAFGLTVGQVTSGTFRQEFDKNGNVTSTKSIVNGVEYQGETQEQFAMRIQAESYLATLKQIGVDATGYTQQYIRDAEAYVKAVQDVATAMQYAQRDLKNGIDVSGGKGLQGAFELAKQFQDGSESITDTYRRLSVEAMNIRQGLDILVGPDSVADIEAFLRTVQDFGESLGQTYDRIASEAADLAAGTKLLTGQSTVAEIESYIRTMQAGGETLAQTYQRLIQASQNYTQFVAQFKPPTTYVDSFQQSLAGVFDQMQEYIRQANAFAKAAGLQGAATQDLVNIQKWALQKQQELLLQLEQTAQAGAFDLGITTVGSLDQVNAEIQRLQNLAGSSATPVQNFGSAMQGAAQSAVSAINLLLGNLSPLNDREKLQTALAGLRSGTVSQEDVLEIGRRLYASSQAYNDLFKMVQQYGGVQSSSGSQGPSTSSIGGGLSAEDSKRLEELLKQRDELQAAAQLDKYRTLAQQIAEIAAVKGQDWQAVLAGMKVDIQAFENGLGLNDEQTRAYIAQIIASQDSNKQNATSIVDAINRLGDRLDRLLRTSGINFNSPGGGNSYVGTLGQNDSPVAGALDRMNRNLDRIIVPPSRNRRAPGVPYP